MRGKVLDFSKKDCQGIISGDDGNRYEFYLSDWKEAKQPKKGNTVDFESDGNKHAFDIFELPDVKQSSDTNIACAVISIVISFLAFITIFDDSPWDAETILGVVFFVFISVALAVITLVKRYQGITAAIISILLSLVTLVYLSFILIKL